MAEPWMETDAHPYGEETLESLESKLAEYRDSLASVKEALQLSPNEPELEKLLKDLQELVSLYEDFVQARIGSATIHQKTREGTFGDVDVTNLKSCLFRSCYAPFEGVLYTATVVEIHPSSDKVPAKVTVEYIGWGNRECLPVLEVQFLAPVPGLTSGATCWAIDPVDGLWHLASVTKADPENGAYFVRFKDSNESLSIPSDRVSITPPTSCVNEDTPSNGRSTRERDQATSRPGKEIITPAGYRIPERLAIKPQDPEKVKQMKKKKISLIKKEQRKELIEQEARDRQSSWQAHAVKKKFKKKDSIFKTSDAPEGKVGVTGSGQKMTRFTHRVRHVFQEGDEDIL